MWLVQVTESNEPEPRDRLSWPAGCSIQLNDAGTSSMDQSSKRLIGGPLPNGFSPCSAKNVSDRPIQCVKELIKLFNLIKN
jgi:hypothetical protein